MSSASQSNYNYYILLHRNMVIKIKSPLASFCSRVFFLINQLCIHSFEKKTSRLTSWITEIIEILWSFLVYYYSMCLRLAWPAITIEPWLENIDQEILSDVNVSVHHSRSLARTRDWTNAGWVLSQCRNRMVHPTPPAPYPEQWPVTVK